MTPWQALGVAPDIAVADLRRRYAALIKEFRPETHPQDFARIREAYEVVLSHARRREAAVAERVGAEEPAVAVAPFEEVPQIADDSTALPIDEEPATPIEVIPAPVVEEVRPEQDAEPALATHFRRFHAEAATAQGSDDEARLPALRALLQARTSATLDDSQALEFALMRWFIEADAPPLTLLFETGRAFDWHRHPARLSTWLSPWALRQMEARLALSRDLVFARHFSGNAWLRRLHAAQPGRPLLVCRPAAVEATSWVERWHRLSEDADAAPLAACLNLVAIQRMRGPASTDLLVGLVAAAFAPDLASGAAWAIVATPVVFGLRRLLQMVGDLPEAHAARRFSGWVSANATVVGVIVLITGAIGVALIAGIQSSAGDRAVGSVLIVPAVLAGTAAIWRIAAFVELLLAWPFLWRGAVDRLEFERCVHSTAVPESHKPFGRRFDVLQRLKSIPAALRLQDVEIAIRERPPRIKPFDLLRIKRMRFVGFKGDNRWRLAWLGLWVVYAIARLLHVVGQ